MNHLCRLIVAVAFASVVPRPASAAPPAAETAALVDFFNATGGPGWDDATGWLNPGIDPCNWHGVSCSLFNQHVVGISLGFNHLVGSLPDSLHDLTSLQTLELFNNELDQTIPDLSGFADLKAFRASSNRLSGSIPALSGLSNLVNFEVAGNRLTGQIPDLTGLSQLQTFFVDVNLLTGSIPTLAGLNNLKRFAVSFNSFTGVVPAPPPALQFGGSLLCPNPLIPTDEPGWDLAVGNSPWWSNCIGVVPIDGVFTDSYE
jgi:hypothetical protein